MKIGGSLIKSGLSDSLLEDIRNLYNKNEMLIVHGGADIVTEIATRLGKEQKFVTSPEGMRSRYTDRETVDIYTMVMSGLVSSKLLLSLNEKGIRCISLSGLDGSLIVAARKKKLVILDERGKKLLIDGGFTGKIKTVNSKLVELVFANGYLPIISPVAISDENEPLNVDSDRVAASLATSMNADMLIFMTNVQGLFLDGKLIRWLSVDEAKRKLATIGPGMQKKVLASIEAVEGGVATAVIGSGNIQSPLQNAIAKNYCTVIERDG